MQNLATYLDLFLYALLATTTSLIVWKIIQVNFSFLLKKPSPRKFVPASEVEMDQELDRLSEGLVWLTTIASTAPFLGLVGTIMHIITALQALGTSADISLISGPIATALNSTLIGLGSAIPALVASNLTNSLLARLQLKWSKALEG